MGKDAEFDPAEKSIPLQPQLLTWPFNGGGR
jgi:hypothetical protein